MPISARNAVLHNAHSGRMKASAPRGNDGSHAKLCLKPKRARLLQTGSFRVIISELHSAGDLAAAQAASANVDMLGRAVHDGLDALHIGLPGTIGSSVGVRDSDAESNTLLAKFTLCHFLKHLLACVS